MGKPAISVIGAYKVEMTEPEMRAYFVESYGGSLEGPDLEYTITAKLAEVRSAVGFDLLVTDADEAFDVGDFKQQGSDQVPYLETFLTVEGESVAWGTKPAQMKEFRVFFFLHMVDENQPLVSSYGAIDIPELRTMPQDLASLHPYLPVD